MKLGFVNERPSQELDSRDAWSETGDRYLLKLFRDYVFHQEDDDGRPMLDNAHVISCLNKLDAGSREKVRPWCILVLVPSSVLALCARINVLGRGVVSIPSWFERQM